MCVNQKAFGLEPFFFFFFSLIVETEKKNPFQRFSRGETGRPGLPSVPRLGRPRGPGAALPSLFPLSALPTLSQAPPGSG